MFDLLKERVLIVCFQYELYRSFTNIASFNEMKPILFYDDISPVVRSVLMLIHELKIDAELKLIDLFKGEHRSNEFFKVILCKNGHRQTNCICNNQQISPNRTVPALKHNNTVITDSHAILIYLVEEFGGQSMLYPPDKLTRIKILDLLFFNGTNLFRRDSDLMTEIIAQSIKDMTHHSVKILECYESLETFLANSSFVAGNDVSYIVTHEEHFL